MVTERFGCQNQLPDEPSHFKTAQPTSWIIEERYFVYGIPMWHDKRRLTINWVYSHSGWGGRLARSKAYLWDSRLNTPFKHGNLPPGKTSLTNGWPVWQLHLLSGTNVLYYEGIAGYVRGLLVNHAIWGELILSANRLDQKTKTERVKLTLLLNSSKYMWCPLLNKSYNWLVKILAFTRLVTGKTLTICAKQRPWKWKQLGVDFITVVGFVAT